MMFFPVEVTGSAAVMTLPLLSLRPAGKSLVIDAG
jgi:hypothetical protein